MPSLHCFSPAAGGPLTEAESLRHDLAAVPGMQIVVGQPVSHRIDHVLSGSRARLVATASGARLRLSALAEIRNDRGPCFINRENVRRKMVAMANVAGLALVPLALSGGQPGSEIQAPMALAILCGLVSSTALNMIAVPALTLRFGSLRRRIAAPSAG